MTGLGMLSDHVAQGSDQEYEAEQSGLDRMHEAQQSDFDRQHQSETTKATLDNQKTLAKMKPKPRGQMSLLEEYADKWAPEPNTGCYLWHGSTCAAWGM